VGTAADGVAELLIRVDTAGAGNVTFAPTGTTGDPRFDGELRSVEGDNALPLTVQTRSTAAGPKAFAIYRAPRDFNHGSAPASLAERQIQLNVTTSSGATASTTIRIFRPPVLLLHGIWSDGDTWRQINPDPQDSENVHFEAELTSMIGGLVVGAGDYWTTNASRFVTNSSVVGAEIGDLRRRFQYEKKAAVSRVDVVAHSMGGILSRIWATDRRYLGRRNFFQGDIHKLITLDSPHLGSYGATLAFALVGDPVIRNMFLAAGIPIDGGAIEDLRLASPAIAAIGPPQAVYAAHALFGQVIDLPPSAVDFIVSFCGPAVDLVLVASNPAIQRLHTLLCHLLQGAQLLQGVPLDGDILVGRASQQGGLRGPQLSQVGLAHTDITRSAEVLNKVVGLLNAPVGEAFSLAGFAVGSSVFRDALLQGQLTSLANQVTSGPGLSITSPTNGTTVRAGDSVLVTVTPTIGANVSEVLLSSEAGVQVLGPPFQTVVVSPDGRLGHFGIAAAAKVAGQFIGDSITLTVTTSAPLVSLQVKPETYTFTLLGAERSLRVEGAFADGTTADISSPEAGTTYLSDNPAVVSIDGQGRLEAKGDGVATVTVRNGGLATTMTVEVAADPDLQPEPPLTPLGAFVNRFYATVLGRPSEPEGQRAWEQYLSGQCNAAGFNGITHGFFESLEFRTMRTLSLNGLVSMLYQTFLDRSPEPQGLAGWASLFRQTRLEIALQGFIPSPEFRGLLPDRHNRAAVEEVITRFYTQILNRAPEPAGFTDWVNYVMATGDLEGAAQEFLASQEFEARALTFRDYVTLLYRTFLEREPDSGGLDGWEAVLREELLDIVNNGFVPSPEFQGKRVALCAS
jgi:pimeloyl-ACP methyl ester carboxylesterase